MRKINVLLTFLTLDGANARARRPGGRNTSGGFNQGGWSVGYFDEAVGHEMEAGDGETPIRLAPRRA